MWSVIRKKINITPGNNQSAFIFEPYRNSCFRSNSLCTACYPLLSSFSCFLSNISCFRFSSYFSCENLFNISVKKLLSHIFQMLILWGKRYYLSPGWSLDAGLQHPFYIFIWDRFPFYISSDDSPTVHIIRILPPSFPYVHGALSINFSILS